MRLILVILFCIGFPAALLARDADDAMTSATLISKLRAGGYIIYFRHAAKDASIADTDRVNLSNCAAQAPLSDEGRAQAKAIGRAFTSLAIPVGGVYTSWYCRCIETARIAFGRAEATEALTSYHELPANVKEERLALLEELLHTAPKPGTNTVLVSHSDFIKDATGEELEEGEAAIFDPAATGATASFMHVYSEEWGAMAGEVPPDASRECFAGAIYRKAVSSADQWDGIEGIVTLPDIEFDPARFSKERGRYLDNPSIYMGGRAGEQEIDAGLTWEVIREPDGTISKERKAFRPFWRNETWNTAPLNDSLCFYPGDTVRMRCATTGRGQMVIAISLIAQGPNAPQDGPQLSVWEVNFTAKSFGIGLPQEFKRVNAIDQVANEGKPAQATTTRVSGARWKSVALIRNGAHVPMTPSRFTDMRCPVPESVQVVPLAGDPTGEVIILNGLATTN